MRKQQQKGFTLVELVIVILILGVLAATALPRFLNVQDDAIDAAHRGIGGGFSSGISLAHAAWMVDAKGTGIKDNLTSFGAGNVDTNAAGWPTDTSNSNVVGGNTTRCINVWSGVLDSAPTVSASTGSDFLVTSSGETCTFTSQTDATRNIVYSATTGQVTIN